jgi:hypothetical protein
MENQTQINLYICQYCKKEYSNKYTLNTHQKTAKNCLKLQEQLKNICQYCEKKFTNQSTLNHHQKTNKSCCSKTKGIIEQSQKFISFICNNCDKSFTSKSYLNKHVCSYSIKILNEKKHLEEKVKELEEKLLTEKKDKLNEIKELEEKLLTEKKDKLNERKEFEEQTIQNKNKITELMTKLKERDRQLDKEEIKNKNLNDKLFEKATTKTNNTTTNILNMFMSQEDVDTKIDKFFTKKHIASGINGIVNFLVEKIATDENGNQIYKCTDSAREFFVYLDTEGNEVKDIKATKLIEMTKPGLMEKTAQIQSKAMNEYKYLVDTYADETPDEDVQKRMTEYKNTSEQARDLMVNKFHDDKFPARLSKELTKKLS